MMMLMIIIAIYWSYKSSKQPQFKEIDRKQVVLRWLSGLIISDYLFFELINSVIYRDSIVTYPFMLTSVLLLLITLDFGRNGMSYKVKGNEVSTQTRITHFSRFVLIGGFALILIIPTVIPMAGLRPTPPGDPAGFGGNFGPYTVNQIKLEHDPPENITDYLESINNDDSWYVFIYYPEMSQTRQIPVAIYIHGFSATNPKEYENTLIRLASRGNIVIFVQYVTNVRLEGPYKDPENTDEKNSNAMYIRYLMEWSGILQAITVLTSKDLIDSGTINPQYMQIVGHSMGAGMIPYIASKITEQGWGGQQLILNLEAPWYTSEHPLVQYNLSRLIDNTIVNIVGYEDDHLASPCIGMHQYERFHSNLPEYNLSYLILPSDYHGFPRLAANHFVVLDRSIDHVLHRWGYLKRVEAMAAFLSALANGEQVIDSLAYIVGGNFQMVTMGNWSDGRPVNPMIYSQDPFGKRGGENLASQIHNPKDCFPP
jgi:hypothetical protein